MWVCLVTQHTPVAFWLLARGWLGSFVACSHCTSSNSLLLSIRPRHLQTSRRHPRLCNCPVLLSRFYTGRSLAFASAHRLAHSSRWQLIRSRGHPINKSPPHQPLHQQPQLDSCSVNTSQLRALLRSTLLRTSSPRAITFLDDSAHHGLHHLRLALCSSDPQPKAPSFAVVFTTAALA